MAVSLGVCAVLIQLAAWHVVPILSEEPCESSRWDYHCPGSYSYDCFSEDDRCDGYDDCSDGYDELGCPEVTDDLWEPQDMTWMWVVIGVVQFLMFFCIFGCICYCRHRRNAAAREQAQVAEQYRQNMPGNYGGANVVVGGYMPAPVSSGGGPPPQPMYNQQYGMGHMAAPTAPPQQMNYQMPYSAAASAPPSYEDAIGGVGKPY